MTNAKDNNAIATTADDSEYDFIPVTKEDASAAIEEAKDARAQDSKYLKIAEGDTFIRLIPLGSGMTGYGPTGREPHAIRFVHFLKITVGGKEKFLSAVCTRMMRHDPRACVTCSFIAEAKRRGIVFIDNPAPRFEALHNVINRAREQDGPRIIKAGTSLHEKLCDKARRYPRVYDPRSTGVDLIINRKGMDRTTEYTVEVDLDGGSRPLGNPAWIAEQHNLMDEITPALSDDELIAKLQEFSAGAVPNTRTPPAPAAVSRGALPARSPARPAAAGEGAARAATPSAPATTRPSRSAQSIAEDGAIDADFE